MVIRASDAFTAADATLLPTYSANWTVNGGQFKINTNSVYGSITTGSGCGIAGYNATTWPADHWAQVIFTASHSGYLDGVGLRIDATGTDNGYYLFGDVSDGIYIGKEVAGVATDFGTSLGTLSVGDVIYGEAVGTTLTAKKNGVVIGTVSSESTFPTGRAGLSYAWGADPLGDSGVSTRVDNWLAGDFRNWLLGAHR